MLKRAPRATSAGNKPPRAPARPGERPAVSRKFGFFGLSRQPDQPGLFAPHGHRGGAGVGPDASAAAPDRAPARRRGWYGRELQLGSVALGPRVGQRPQRQTGPSVGPRPGPLGRDARRGTVGLL